MTGSPEKRSALKFETVGSIVAMVIGASALFIAWDQAQVMRAQQHASVWPLINADFTVDPSADGLSLELRIANRGVGPALIESAFLQVDGEKVEGRAALTRAIFSDNPPAGAASLVGSSIESMALGAGENAQVFRVAWRNNDANVAAFTALGERYLNGAGPDVAMTVCYCSVFDRCFVSNDKGRPERVKSCPAATNLFANMLRDNQVAAQ